MNKYIEFTGEETEIEFLEKCIEQWEIAQDEDFFKKMMMLGSMFREVRHRIEELKEETE